MITVVVGKEIEKLKGEFESVINGMNMVGEIPYNVYSELFDVGTDCIQKAYELGKSELKKEAKEWIRKNSKEFITNPKYSPFDYAEAIYLAGAEPREKRIAELEAIARNTKATDESFALLTLQLIEAKKIIRSLLTCCRNYPQENAEKMRQAEKFIKDSEIVK